MILRANPIHRLLHLPVTAIAAFHRIRCRWEQFIVQKNEALLQCRRLQLFETLRQPLESLHAVSQFSQFLQSRVDRTTAVEQAINLVGDLSQFAQLRKASRDCLERLTFLLRQMMSYEKKTILEQCRDLRLNPFVHLDGPLILRLDGTSTFGPLRHRLGKLATDLRHRFQDRLVDFLENVEDADLVPNPWKNSLDRFRIKIRTVRRDTVKFQAAMCQNVFERIQKLANIVFVRTAFENPICQPLEFAIVDDRQDAKRSVVDFVDRDVAGKHFKSDGEIVIGLDEQASFFPLPPRPSFGSWRKERKLDGPARDANWLPCTVNRPRRRRGWQARPRCGCSANRERQGRSCRR